VLLTAIVLVSGLLSAFFVNDTMCLVLTPLVLEITKRLQRNPLPYLLGVAMSSNCGSVATVTGNPQNMLIGTYSGIPYTAFAAALAPVALAGMALTIVVLAFVYRNEFRKESRLEPEQHRVRVRRALLWKSVAVSLGMIALFFAGWPVHKVAVVAGALLLITRRVKPERIYHEIDWSLLVMFIGLFIVVAGMEKTGLAESAFAFASRFHLDRVGPMSVCTALMSNLVSNVPAVLMFKSVVPKLANPSRAWLALAMSSTLAGNLTLMGSVANLIVVERARREIRISFWEYAKAGVPLAVLRNRRVGCYTEGSARPVRGSPMFLSVKEMELRKIRFDESFQPGQIDFSGEDLEQLSALHATGSAELLAHTDGEVRVQGRYQVEMLAQCDRCLASARFPIDASFDLFYRPVSFIAKEEEVGIDEGEAEIGFYEGGGLELEEILQEQVLLGLPMQRVCSDVCKGICPVCGKNRNEAACECKIVSGDDRWGALRKLQL
jgi:Na+/H+ antiporter NhaD/arsenite permease-like protein/uncharacterized metal-binding protein YceD (DUF177 family)